jgi:hypothetical protein
MRQAREYFVGIFVGISSDTSTADPVSKRLFRLFSIPAGGTNSLHRKVPHSPLSDLNQQLRNRGTPETVPHLAAATDDVLLPAYACKRRQDGASATVNKRLQK